jgi:ABC-2 type transport system ATP-binding protein
MNDIETKDLIKRREDVEAVRGITLEIEEGKLSGLLGPNGAGKTTGASMLCTITKSTSVAEVSGSDAKVDLGTVLRQIGIVLQKPSFEDGLTGEKNLDFHGEEELTLFVRQTMYASCIRSSSMG